MAEKTLLPYPWRLDLYWAHADPQRPWWKVREIDDGFYEAWRDNYYKVASGRGLYGVRQEMAKIDVLPEYRRPHPGFREGQVLFFTQGIQGQGCGKHGLSWAYHAEGAWTGMVLAVTSGIHVGGIGFLPPECLLSALIVQGFGAPWGPADYDPADYEEAP